MKKNFLISMVAIAAAACLLFALNLGLDGIARSNRQKVQQHMMEAMAPGSKTFTQETYTGEDANIVTAWKGETGYVVETRTYGYAGWVSMLVGVSNDGQVTGLVVTDLSETPGLGANALTDWEFLARFLNTKGDVAIGTAGADAFTGATGADTTEAQTYVDGITGATVTSKAVARCVNSAVAYVTGADAASSATSWGG